MTRGIRDDYLLRFLGSSAMAASSFARDLTRDDAATFKVGYTIENAILAAVELFPEVDEKRIRRINAWDSE